LLSPHDIDLALARHLRRPEPHRGFRSLRFRAAEPSAAAFRGRLAGAATHPAAKADSV